MLETQDLVNLLVVVERATFAGNEVEGAAILKKKLIDIITANNSNLLKNNPVESVTEPVVQENV